MDKETYNVDDILSEVKKRRKENEAQLNRKAQAQKNAPEKKAQENLDSEKEQYVDQLVDSVIGVPQSERKKAAPSANAASVQNKKADQNPPAEKQAKNPPEENTADIPFVESEQPQMRLPEEKIQAVQQEKLPHAGDAQAEPDAPVMIDLFSLTNENGAQQEENEKKKGDGTPWRKTKKGKIILSVIGVLVVLIIGGVIFGVCYVSGLLDKFTDDTKDYKKTDTSYHGMDFLEENFPAIEEMDASQATTYKEYLKAWYQNGDPVSSTHVKNILLIGEDTREEEISDTSRADSAIIASVNIDTGKITLTSVLRDLYVYFEVDGNGQYGKINAAASQGGMEEYIRTVERYYKIQIDNYAVVNFASFPKIIDSLGGVEIEITDREIHEINNHPKRYGDVYIEKTYEGTEGKMKLDGTQALAYCRIRKIDSDNARADRQKTVLLQVFNMLKSASNKELLKTVNDLVGYVYTGYSKKELVSLATYALSNGWMNYETQTTSVPTTENARGGNYLIGETLVTPCSSTQGVWLWKSDIPQDAYDLQLLIYGKSNITLAENRCDYVNLN